MDPILVALNSEEIAEALRDYVLRKTGLDPAAMRVHAQVSYNTKGGLIAAVALHESAEVPRC